MGSGGRCGDSFAPAVGSPSHQRNLQWEREPLDTPYSPYMSQGRGPWGFTPNHHSCGSTTSIPAASGPSVAARASELTWGGDRLLQPLRPETLWRGGAWSREGIPRSQSSWELHHPKLLHTLVLLPQPPLPALHQPPTHNTETGTSSHRILRAREGSCM